MRKKIFTLMLCLLFFGLGMQFASKDNNIPKVDKNTTYTQNVNDVLDNNSTNTDSNPINVQGPTDENESPSTQVNNNIEPTIQKPIDDTVANNNDTSNTIIKKDTNPSEQLPIKNNTNQNNTSIPNEINSDVSIGNISLNSTNADIMQLYGKYLHDSTVDTKYFVGGPGQYGDFMLTVEFNNTSIKRITYLQNNMTNSVLTMNFNSTKVGTSLDSILNTYGKPSSNVINYDVKKITYTNISSISNIIFYIDKNKNTVYGFEIVRK